GMALVLAWTLYPEAAPGGDRVSTLAGDSARSSGARRALAIVAFTIAAGMLAFATRHVVDLARADRVRTTRNQAYAKFLAEAPPSRNLPHMSAIALEDALI